MIARRGLGRSLRNETMMTLSSTDGWFDALTTTVDRVTADKALEVSPIHAAVRVVSDSIGKLPCHVFRPSADGGREIDKEHSINWLLNVRPNEAMTPMMLRKAATACQMLWGNAYIAVKFNTKGKPAELLLMPSEGAQIFQNEKGELSYQFTVNGLMRTLKGSEVIHLPWIAANGIVGKGLMDYAKETISTDLSAQKFAGKFYRNGARPSGIVEVPTEANGDSKEIIRGEFERMVSGVDNAFRVAVLDLGMKYTQMGLPQKDAQFIESRGFAVEEVARFTGVPLYKLQTGKQSYQSNEQQGLDYVMNTLHPIVTQWEQEVGYKLFLTPELKKGYYLRFNMAAEMRADNESRSRYYEVMLRNGIYSINECRAFEEMNNVAGGDEHFITRNYTTLALAVKGDVGGGTVIENASGKE